VAVILDQPDLEPVALIARRGRSARRCEGYRLEEPWSYTWTTAPSLEVGAFERTLIVPVGFLSDGASVPRILWTLTGIIPDGLIRAAALIHDALYRFRGQLQPGWLFERPLDKHWRGTTRGWIEVPIAQATYTRQSADAMFARIMREAGVGEHERSWAYRGVRACGWATWMREAEVLELERT
jgi:hypothetical protein